MAARSASFQSSSSLSNSCGLLLVFTALLMGLLLLPRGNDGERWSAVANVADAVVGAGGGGSDAQRCIVLVFGWGNGSE